MTNIPKQPVNRLQRKATQTKRKLKQATLDILSEKTIDSITVEEITQKADVGKGTLYQHFTDKEDIVLTLIDEAMNHLLARIKSYQKKPDTLEGMLEYMLDAHYGFCMECREEFLLLFQGKLLLKLQSDTVDELEEPYLCYLHEIESEISSYLSPQINPMKVRRLACAVAGFVFGFLSFGIIAMSEDEIDTSIKPLRRVFVKSMCVFLGR